MWMIGLAAGVDPFFIQVNPNAAMFTPHLNKIRDWNFGCSTFHQYLLLLLRTWPRVSLAVMEQQVPNNRLNDECSDQYTFYRSVHRITASTVSLVCTFAWLLSAEMKRVSKILKLAIVIQRCWPPPILEPQPFEELDFLRGPTSAKRTIFEEFPQARLFIRYSSGFSLHKLKSLQIGRSDSSIQDDLQAE